MWAWSISDKMHGDPLLENQKCGPKTCGIENEKTSHYLEWFNPLRAVPSLLASEVSRPCMNLDHNTTISFLVCCMCSVRPTFVLPWWKVDRKLPFIVYSALHSVFVFLISYGSYSSLAIWLAAERVLRLAITDACNELKHFRPTLKCCNHATIKSCVR